MKTSVAVPADIAKAYNAYGFAKRLETAVAVRESRWSGWYAILFNDGGAFYAVDFVTDMRGDWEVQNDYIGPFESVDAFLTERLTTSLI